MDYEFVDDEAKPVASTLDAYLAKTYSEVSKGKAAWDEAPYRTTFYVRDGPLTMLFEVQERPHIGERFRSFTLWLAAQRQFAELRIVVSDQAQIAASFLSELRSTGIGLLVLKDSDKFVETFAPRNPALIVTPDPTLRYGPLKTEVYKHIEKFNGGQRKDGLRDMCELVEGELEKTLKRAIQKGWCVVPAASAAVMDMSSRIDTLASAKATAVGKAPLVDDKLKTDLHSFRGARNLIDHPVKTKREDSKRQKQFSERMMMGPRLVAELLTIKRRI